MTRLLFGCDLRPRSAISARQRQTLAADLSAYLNAALGATEQEAVWSETCAFFRKLGIRHVIYGYSPVSKGQVLGARSDLLILSTMTAEAMEGLIDGGHFLQSLTLHWALRNVGIASWSMPLEDSGVDPDFTVDLSSLAFFDAVGMRAGATIGFSSEKMRGKAIMALVADPEVPQDQMDTMLCDVCEQIYIAASVAHRCLSNLPFSLPGRTLTPRQREVLEWVAEGKTIADIALIMGITNPTVEKHLRLARETLGVDTTPHALIKATFLNQIFTSSPQGVEGQDDIAHRLRLIETSASLR